MTGRGRQAPHRSARRHDAQPQMVRNAPTLNNHILHLPVEILKRSRMVVLRDPPFDRTIIPTSHKRRHLSCSSPASPTDVAHRSSKKPKLSHPAIPPPRFWDDLSEIHLTRNALGELDRRNAKVARDSTRRRKCRIRRATVEKIESPQPGFLGQCSPTCLRQIKRFATHGGPDLSNLRGYRALDPAYGMSSSKSSLGRRKRGSQSPSKSGTTANTTTTKSTGPYDRAFQQHLIDYSVFPDDYEYPDGHLPLEPENLDDILRALRQPRASLSPSRFSNEDFRKFKRADTQASKERQVTTNVIPIIERDVRDGKCVAGEVPFTNLDHLTDGTLVPGNPDLYYGARPEQLDREVRREPDGHIIPSTQQDLPIARTSSSKSKDRTDPCQSRLGRHAMTVLWEREESTVSSLTEH